MIAAKDTLRARILTYLSQHGGASLSEMARNLETSIADIRDKLYISKRNGHVTNEMRKTIGPTGGPILSSMWEITEEGRKWLSLVEST